MPPTPYPELNEVLDHLVSRLQLLLGETFIGAYLQGSFAVGDFDEHSDVDFIVALEEVLTLPQVAALQEMHDQVYELSSEWAQHLEGSYFPKAMLRDYTKSGRDLWYLDHGARTLVRSDHCNTILVRWVVREQGVPLAGPPPKTLIDAMPRRVLRAEIFEVLTGWGREILADPAPYRNRFYQGFIVLNYCRMLHDLRRGYPGSKREGAAWAKGALESGWIPLIEGAWACRPDPAWQAREPPDPEAFEETLRFVAYVIERAERYVKRRGHTTSARP